MVELTIGAVVGWVFGLIAIGCAIGIAVASLMTTSKRNDLQAEQDIMEFVRKLDAEKNGKSTREKDKPD